jgi:hypothetical protein
LEADLLQTFQDWVVAVLVYPGLLFAVSLALVGAWLAVSLRPLWTPRLYRAQATQARPHHFLQPLNDLLKLARRQRLTYPTLLSWPRPGEAVAGVVQGVCAIAPVLALALTPFPGSPLASGPMDTGDLFVVLALLAAQPICRAVLRLRTEGAERRGAQDLNRLAAGFLPVVVAIAALIEASRGESLAMASLAAAPETGWQFVVRLLAGAALFVALPIWLDPKGVAEVRESAGNYAGKHLERAALAAFWAYLALPAPGETPWAVTVVIVGTLAAYVGMRVVAERVSMGRREDEAAAVAWGVSLPLATVALLAALWSGA